MLNRQLLQIALRMVDALDCGGDTFGKRLVFKHGGGKFQITDMDFFPQDFLFFSKVLLDFGEPLMLFVCYTDLLVQPNVGVDLTILTMVRNLE